MRTSAFVATCLVVALFSATNLRAQYLEIGLQGGGMTYSGDLSPEPFGLFVTDAKLAGGAYLRYRPLNRIGLRFNALFGRVGADHSVKLLNEVGEKVSIDRNFRSKVEEFSAVLELDLFYLGNKDRNFTTLFIYGGYGIINFSPQSQLDGVYYDLQPLRTEGQGIGGERYEAEPYSLTEDVIPVGLGIRARFLNRFTIGVDLGGRLVGNDYLDDVSGRNINYLEVLENSNSLGARLSNPAVQDIGAVGDLDYIRGGEFNDFYYIGTVTFGITLGDRGNGAAGSRSGCYDF